VPYAGLAARWHALRVRTVDAALRRVLAGAPDAAVTALGLDLPEGVAVRREVLPDGPRNRTLTGFCEDPEWTAQAVRERPVIITARGLLPYCGRAEVHRMLIAWAHLFPGAGLLSDAVTTHLQEVRRGNPLPGGYRPPDWTWTVDTDEVCQPRERPGVTDWHEVPQAGGDPAGRRAAAGARPEQPGTGLPGGPGQARPRHRGALISGANTRGYGTIRAASPRNSGEDSGIFLPLSRPFRSRTQNHKGSAVRKAGDTPRFTWQAGAGSIAAGACSWSSVACALPSAAGNRRLRASGRRGRSSSDAL
jgi:hypothetical protein